MPALLLSFLFNKYVMGGLLIAVIVFGLYEKGRLDAASNQREAALKSQVALMQRDVDNAKAAEADAAKRIVDLEAATVERDKEDAAYAEELKSRPDRCDLTPADIGRLHNDPGKGNHR